jgi:hypothetical protein
MRELRAGFVHVDADDVAVLMKVLPEHLDGAALFDTNLFISNKSKYSAQLGINLDAEETSMTYRAEDWYGFKSESYLHISGW